MQSSINAGIGIYRSLRSRAKIGSFACNQDIYAMRAMPALNIDYQEIRVVNIQNQHAGLNASIRSGSERLFLLEEPCISKLL
jgi:hypothetical protein